MQAGVVFQLCFKGQLHLPAKSRDQPLILDSDVPDKKGHTLLLLDGADL
jgi:hypothetical protein